MIKWMVKRVLGAVGFELHRLPRPLPPVHRTIVNAHYAGHKFRCIQGDPQCEWILRGEGWDNQLVEVLAMIPRGGEAHVVEVGANVGGSLLPRMSERQDLTFHCLEPVPEFFDLLQENAASFGINNVKLYRMAAGAKHGEIVHLFTQLGTAGRLAEYDGHPRVGVVDVSATTLDELFADQPVVLLKIDTDGFELDVLRGAEAILAKGQPLLFMEFHERIMREAGIDPYAVTSFLAGRGYRFARAWDNVGRWQADVDDLGSLHVLSERAPAYLDVLFSPRPLAVPVAT